MAKSGLGAYTLRIHKKGAIGYTALSRDMYTELIRFFDKSIASDISYKPPLELRLERSNATEIVKTLSYIFSAKRNPVCHILFVESLGSEPDERQYDNLCEALHIEILRDKAVLPWCITIAVTSSEVFKESVILERLLKPACESKKIGLILLSLGTTVMPEIICQGTLPDTNNLPILGPSKIDSNPQSYPHLTRNEIGSLFQCLFGHFELKRGDNIYHVPSVASVSKLARTPGFIVQMKEDLAKLVDSQHFSILPFGIEGGGIDELSLNLVDGDNTRVIDGIKAVNKHHIDRLVILCDFISQIYPIEEAIREATNKGTKILGLAGIARFRDAQQILIPTRYYLDTNYCSTEISMKSECKFCEQGVSPIQGDHFRAFSSSVKEFDAFTFWEFVSQSKDSLRVGHWISPITPNHYYFRIWTDPIFELYSYGISIRLVNALRKKGVLPSWIHKIVCTDENESLRLSHGLAQELGLRGDDVIAIPRDKIKSMAGNQLDSELLRYLDSGDDKRNLRNKNVLIVDQAAHHFKTLSALNNVCEYYNSVVLAFAIFVDRTNPALLLEGDYLLNSHYVPLYSWPISPRRAHECACAIGGSKI